MSIRRLLACTTLFLLLGAQAYGQSATTAVEMLREMFRQPVTEWQHTLEQSKPLLTTKFFEDVEKRIRWGIENNHVDDAIRFAMVGDFGSEVKGRPANFRIDLAELFFKAQNYMMAGQLVDNIIITSNPKNEVVKRAKFLRAELLETEQSWYAARETYLTLAKEGYKADICFYRAGLISEAADNLKEAVDEYTKAKALGHVEAGVHLAKIKAVLDGGFVPEAIPPLENRPGIDTTTGVAATNQNGGQDLAAYLVAAKAAVQNGNLAEAKSNYEGALKKDPASAEAVRGMAALLYRSGALDDARAFLDNALMKFPEDPDLWRYRANTYERLFDRKKQTADLDAALKDYKKALQLAPNHPFLSGEYERAKAKKK